MSIYNYINLNNTNVYNMYNNYIHICIFNYFTKFYKVNRVRNLIDEQLIVLGLDYVFKDYFYKKKTTTYIF